MEQSTHYLLSLIQTYEMTTIKNNELIVQLKADNPDWFD
ncbi:hypothetical protein M093_1067 [Bacteroides uniformis str. 3978 T3 i]|uniref:Uncharacterized protein n=1 Tax=Bacteroides uniformis str. 3978 T3 ii TaxID=1339349 RepID=A0A078S7X1_BACUN|nr:hypothetical protein M094_3928 [Bacteroides uniformis str. 3978 T3 ii]KDS61687.1 hypothetical protein M093_1067 [Bacteroides uniformis str. 3978 T3 i]